MKTLVQENQAIQEVTYETFAIDGCADEFGAHRALPGCIDAGKPAFSATHLASGFSIGRGDTLESAIADGRRQWASKSPEQRHTAISRAMGLRKMMAGETGGAA